MATIAKNSFSLRKTLMAAVLLAGSAGASADTYHWSYTGKFDLFVSPIYSTVYGENWTLEMDFEGTDNGSDATASSIQSLTVGNGTITFDMMVASFDEIGGMMVGLNGLGSLDVGIGGIGNSYTGEAVDLYFP